MWALGIFWVHCNLQSHTQLCFLKERHTTTHDLLQCKGTGRKHHIGMFKRRVFGVKLAFYQMHPKHAVHVPNDMIQRGIPAYTRTSKMNISATSYIFLKCSNGTEWFWKFVCKCVRRINWRKRRLSDLHTIWPKLWKGKPRMPRAMANENLDLKFSVLKVTRILSKLGFPTYNKSNAQYVPKLRSRQS